MDFKTKHFEAWQAEKFNTFKKKKKSNSYKMLLSFLQKEQMSELKSNASKTYFTLTLTLRALSYIMYALSLFSHPRV